MDTRSNPSQDRRRKILRISAAIIVLLLAVGLTYTLWPAKQIVAKPAPIEFTVERGQGLAPYLGKERTIAVSKVNGILLYRGKQMVPKNLVSYKDALKVDTDWTQLTMNIRPGVYRVDENNVLRLVREHKHRSAKRVRV